MSEPLGGLFAKPYEEIRALEARSRMDTGAILVDVREPAEWAAGHASNLEGGVRAWSAAGLPVVTESGRPGAVI
jgi:rhodanese-related sulfurtransferase